MYDKKITFQAQLLHKTESYDQVSQKHGSKMEMKISGYSASEGSSCEAGGIDGRVLFFTRTGSLVDYFAGQKVRITIEPVDMKISVDPAANLLHACGPTAANTKKRKR